MSKDKQIEEMAKAMHDGCSIVKATNQCRGEDCLDCGAVTLYEKGYRKASEVAREIFADLKAIWNEGRGFINYGKLVRLERIYTEERK